MKKTLLYTSLLLFAGVTGAMAADGDLTGEVTLSTEDVAPFPYTFELSPLTDAASWTFGTNKSTNDTSHDASISNGVLKVDACGWKQSYGVYDLTSTNVVFENNGVDKLAFSFDVQYPGSTGSKAGDLAVMLSFIGKDSNGNDVVVTMGHGSYSHGQYRRFELGTTGTLGNFYQTQAADTAGVYVSDFQTVLGIFELGNKTTVSGAFTLNEAGQTVLSVYGLEKTLDLVSISSIHIGIDGDSGATPSVSGLKLAYTTMVPEPATATLSLLALAGLAARRRRK